MTQRASRLGAALERETPQWGIHPVPRALRTLSGPDLGVLWGDLSIGLLVLVSGSLLVPSLGLPSATAAIVIGSLIGCLPLALVAAAGARDGVPGMVLFRPVLGRRGSYAPSALNLVQLVGWTGFELWAMGRVANAIGRELFGFDAPLVWIALVAVLCTALALAGPIFAVRRWLERFGVWIVAAVAIWITVRVVLLGDLRALWVQPGAGGLPFWLAVDLVIAMPISWLPLAADFTRFARSPRAAFTGTYGSYAVGNIWFYLLGALLVLAAGGTSGDVLDIGTTIAAAVGGGVVLLLLLAGEIDQGMADIYSGAMSVQNVKPSVPQRPLIVGLGAAGFVLAALLREDAVATFEFFLFLIGSVFVPLFGVFLADRWVLRRGGFAEDALFDGAPPGVRWRAVVPWVAGFVCYQWCVPTGPDWWTGGVERLFSLLGLPFPLFADTPIGASIPAFAVAFLLALVVLPRSREA